MPDIANTTQRYTISVQFYSVLVFFLIFIYKNVFQMTYFT